VNGTQYEKEFLGFLPECGGFITMRGLCGDQHAEPMLSFLRFSFANANTILEFFSGAGFIGFDMVCADTRRLGPIGE
jgi:hypothetical protein